MNFIAKQLERGRASLPDFAATFGREHGPEGVATAHSIAGDLLRPLPYGDLRQAALFAASMWGWTLIENVWLKGEKRGRPYREFPEEKAHGYDLLYQGLGAVLVGLWGLREPRAYPVSAVVARSDWEPYRRPTREVAEMLSALQWLDTYREPWERDLIREVREQFRVSLDDEDRLDLVALEASFYTLAIYAEALHLDSGGGGIWFLRTYSAALALLALEARLAWQRIDPSPDYGDAECRRLVAAARLKARAIDEVWVWRLTRRRHEAAKGN